MKLIIDNRTNRSDREAMHIAFSVIELGHISTGRFGKQYCHLSTRDGVTIFVQKRKSGTQTFIIQDDAHP